MLRRTLSAVLLAALVAAPSLSSAQTRRATTTTTAPDALQVGGGLGFEFGAMDSTGFGLRVEGVYPLQRLQNNINLGIHGQLGYTRWSEEESAFGFEVSSTVNAFKLVPALRVSLAAAPNVTIYGDAGIGLYFGNVSVEIEGEDDSEGISGAMMRFAAGGLFAVSPQLSIGGELGLNPYFGDIDDATISLFATLLYRL